MNAARETWVSEQTDPVQPTYRAPRRYRRTGKLTLVAIVLVLVAIAVVGDRVAAKFATEQLQTRLVAAVDDHNVGYETIDVEIGGFPFLTQVARGRYDAISIDMTEVRLTTTTGRVVTLPTLHAVASGVNANTSDVVRGDANVVADRVDGTATVSFTTLQTIIDYQDYALSDVTFADSGGGLKVNATANVAGQKIPLSAVAVIAVYNGQLQIALRDATAVGVSAPQFAKDYLSRLAVAQLAARLPALPFGLKLDHVSVLDDGLAVSATGVNVPLTR
jgi:LmeA-like phospholipid-binding